VVFKNSLHLQPSSASRRCRLNSSKLLQDPSSQNDLPESNSLPFNLSLTLSQCSNKEPLLNSTLIDEDFQRQLQQPPSPPASTTTAAELGLALQLMLEQSLRRLARMEAEYHQVTSRKTAKAHRRLGKMRREAEEELQQLNTAIHQASTSTGPVLPDMEQITEIERLLEKWTRLTAKIDLELCPTSSEDVPFSDEVELAPLPPEGHTGVADVGMEGSGTVIISLHGILEEMKKQLRLLKSFNGQRSGWSLEEIGEVVEARKVSAQWFVI